MKRRLETNVRGHIGYVWCGRTSIAAWIIMFCRRILEVNDSCFVMEVPVANDYFKG